jgi:hypothetical protein
LSFARSTNNLTPCAMKSIVRNVINLMVSSSTLDFTNKNSYNCKTMWRKKINNNNFGDIVIGSWNKTKQNKQTKRWKAWVVNGLAHKCNKGWKLWNT